MPQNPMNQTQTLIRLLGGADNILSVTNCATRLRVRVKTEAIIDDGNLRSAEDVLGLVHDRKNTYEIVVGPGKSKKYADCCYQMGLPKSENPQRTDITVEAPEGTAGPARGTSRFKAALKMIGDIFVPLIPGIIVAGLCAGLSALITQFVPEAKTVKIWQIIVMILGLINTSLLTYLTAWVGYRAAERFGATPILGGMLGMITTLDGINDLSRLLGLFNEQAPLTSVLRVGKGGVLAVIIGVYLLSVVEKKVRARMPESLDVVVSPLLALLICVVPYILVIMPLFGYVSTGIVWVFGKLCLADNVLIRMITGYVSAAMFLPLVAAGLHHGLVALYSVQLQELGYITLYPALAMAGAGQVGAALALWLKAKREEDTKRCRIIAGALPAGILGIGEPLVYGVTLPLGTPFITAGLGAGFGGALVMAFEVASTTWGVSGILGVFVMTAGPNGALMNALIYLAGLALSVLGGFGITALVYRKKIPSNSPADPEPIAQPKADQKDPPFPNEKAGHQPRHVTRGEPLTIGKPDRTGTGKQSDDTVIAAPATGCVITMEDIPDPVFSDGTMGECLAILPENGRVTSPCDGVVSMIFDTKHAIVLTTADGKAILIHVGLDTVKLGGKGFALFVTEGASIEKGDLLMQAELSVIADAGLSPMVITAVLPSFCSK